MSIRKPEVGQKRRMPLVPEIRTVDDANRTITFVASTESVDRFGDIIRVGGWRFDNYLKNPVFQWAHRYQDPPIGRTVRLQIETDPPALVQTVRFATKDEYPFADTIYKLYKGGYLHAVSVGFKPLKPPALRKDEDGAFLGYEFNEQELIELSAVPVPANPDALALACRKGVVSDSDLVLVRGEDNAPWTYLIPGVTFAADDVSATGGNAGRTSNLLYPNEAEGAMPAQVQPTKLPEEPHTTEGLNQETAVTDEDDIELGDTVQAVVNSDHCRRRIARVLRFVNEVPKMLESITASLASLHEKLDASQTAPADDQGLDVEAIQDSRIKIADAVTKEWAETLEATVASHDAAIAELRAAKPIELVAEIVEPAESKTAIPYKNEKLADRDYEWDAAKEMAKVDDSDGWRRMCTVIVGDEENKTSYKLPHHRGGDYATVFRGVVNALQRFEQTEMPSEDRAPARRHLTRHRAEFEEEEGAGFDAETLERKMEIFGVAYRGLIGLGCAEGAAYFNSHLRMLALGADRETPEPEKAKNDNVQTIIFEKEYWTLEEAKEWLAKHDRRSDKVDETENTYRFRQFEPSECKEGTYLTLTENLPTGVSYVVCERKTEEGCGCGSENEPTEPQSELDRLLKQLIAPKATS